MAARRTSLWPLGAATGLARRTFGLGARASSPVNIAAGDLDGDGLIEIIAETDEGFVRVLKSQ